MRMRYKHNHVYIDKESWKRKRVTNIQKGNDKLKGKKGQCK